jgi:DNA-binding NtrC family response regulator
MDATVPVLVISCRSDNRKLLMRVFEDLPLDVYTAGSLQQARETLKSHSFSAVFCEERLSDGSYRELLAELRSASANTRFVVLLCTGEWDEYLEALRLGAEEVLRCPLQPTDVDLALIHTMRSVGPKKDLNAPRQGSRAMGAVA